MNTEERIMKNEIIIKNEDMENTLKNEINQYIGNGLAKICINVYGQGGVGKSTFLREICKEYKESYYCAYINASDCMNEVELLRMVVEQLKAVDKKKFKFPKFEFLYECFFGDYSKKTKVSIQEAKNGYLKDKFSDIRKDLGENAMETLSDIIEKKLSEGVESGSNDYWKGLNQVFGDALVPGLGFITKALGLMVKKVNDERKKRFAERMLESISSNMDSEYLRRKEMKSFFIEELNDSLYEERAGERTKVICIIDNFCLNKKTEFWRNLEWLLAQDGIINSTDVAWIIGSRLSFYPVGIEIGENTNYREVEMYGFTCKEAMEYIKQKWENDGPKVEIPDIWETEYCERILEICALSRNHMVHKYYSPYKLFFVMTHCLKIYEEKGAAGITGELFNKIADEKFFSEYFYMDLADYLLNAVQILACADTWNEERLDIVRKKFNDILLNTRHLLKQNVAIEEIDADKFKLHDETRMSLYNSMRNVLKYDVQEYIFKEYIKILENQETEENILKNQNIYEWYINLSLDYLKFLKVEYPLYHKRFMEKINGFIAVENIGENILEKRYKQFFSCLDKVYRKNKGAEVVTEEFADFYNYIVNGLKEVICEEEVEEIENGENRIVYKSSPLYILLKLKMADILTWLSRPQEARVMEQFCIDEAQRIYHRNQNGNSLELHQAQWLLLKCKNAYAYDCSYHWNYNEAYKMGKECLEDARKFICCTEGDAASRESLIGELLCGNDLTDELRESLISLNGFYWNNCVNDASPINSREFPCASEINDNDLVKAFKVLFVEGIKEKHSEKGKLLKTLIKIIAINNMMRGNFPWYCISENRVMDNNENNSETVSRENLLQYSKDTYLLRRIQEEAYQAGMSEVEANKKNDYIKTYKQELGNLYTKSLVSYHNIAVYNFKLGNLEEAVNIGTEACFRRMHYLPAFQLEELNEFQDLRRKEVLEGNNSEEYCMEKIGQVMNISIKEHLRENEETIESIQYLGDYYLHRRQYELAKDKLGEAFINKYIRQGFKNFKTLDCAIRLATAFVAINEIGWARWLADKVCTEADLMRRGQGDTNEMRINMYSQIKDEIASEVEREDRVEAILAMFY